MRKRVAMASALALVAAITAIAVGGAGSAAATGCGSSTGCLPGSGYTLDSYWNCGAIDTEAGQYCYYNGTTNYSAAISHTWGFVSADYDGGGSTYVCAEALNGSSSFSYCDTNLARACYYSNCNDQGSIYYNADVENFDGGAAHTIYGHAEA